VRRDVQRGPGDIRNVAPLGTLGAKADGPLSKELRTTTLSNDH
jgi:hypothetical protein